MTQHSNTPPAYQLLPEWAEQEAVVLVWPDEQTDWADTLDDIRRCYVEFIEAIARFEPVVLVVRDIPEAETWLLPWLSTVAKEALRMVQADYDDTWARDTMPLTCVNAGGMLPMWTSASTDGAASLKAHATICLVAGCTGRATSAVR